MASDRHADIRDFLEETNRTGAPPAGKRMVLNPRTGKFEVQSAGERSADQIPEMDVEDMKAFGDA
ncbi:hypothetical protein [Actinomadura atramentaria]|uniref:hypothetical protein n=1 Tax=Actinomadura atramentaria TaxID=1990 RepID=UPI00039F9414|nr:hypothetical protein [Actinomadura atramentaria]